MQKTHEGKKFNTKFEPLDEIRKKLDSRLVTYPKEKKHPKKLKPKNYLGAPQPQRLEQTRVNNA